MTKKRNNSKYDKWGYRFIAPFFIVYLLFSLIPLLSTFYYSFFEYYYSNGTASMVGPNFIGLRNYIEIFRPVSEGGNVVFFQYLGNTVILWLMGFIPQIIISLLLALWFTNMRLNIKAQGFFKTVIYMPNLVMAAAFSMLFSQLFANNSGAFLKILVDSNIVSETFSFVDNVWPTRLLISLMNFIMWFGNTTILMMAGIMGIDDTLIESAQVDGANSFQVFFKIILPLLKPILLFVLVTSLVGGMQMFDIPQIFTKGTGGPQLSSRTIMMYINGLLGTSKQYGKAGAVSVMLFIITAFISLIFFRVINNSEIKEKKKAKLIERGITSERKQ